MTRESNELGLEVENSRLEGIGERLRSYRLMRGWTLDQLATKAKLSKSYISRLEDSDRQPSIAALISISRALGITLSALLSDDSAPRGICVVRGEEQPAVAGNGLVYQVHSGGMVSSVMQPLRITISAERTGEELYRHEGEEWLFVLSGQLAVTIGGERYTLGPGDSIQFDATTGHRLSVIGEKDVEAILVASVAPKALLSSYL